LRTRAYSTQQRSASFINKYLYFDLLIKLVWFMWPVLCHLAANEKEGSTMFIGSRGEILAVEGL
jgi:hypothetical protein